MDKSLITAKSQKEWRTELMGANDASRTMPPCGTAACIAGWAVVLTDGVPSKIREFMKMRERAAELLNVDAGYSWTSHPLFYAPNWPKPFASRYRNAEGPKKRAIIAAERIEHLIKTGE